MMLGEGQASGRTSGEGLRPQQMVDMITPRR